MEKPRSGKSPTRPGLSFVTVALSVSLPHVRCSDGQCVDAADRVRTRIYVVSVFTHHALVGCVSRIPLEQRSVLFHPAQRSDNAVLNVLAVDGEDRRRRSIDVLEERDAVVIELLEAAIQLLRVHVALQRLAESDIRIPLDRK